MNEKQNGFTLIELIVVVFLIGLMASMAALNFNRNLDSLAYGEAKRYSQVLSYIKEYSAYSGRIMSLRLNQPAHTYFFLYIDPLTRRWDKLGIDSANKLLHPHKVDNRVTLKLTRVKSAVDKTESANSFYNEQNPAKQNNLEIAFIAPFSDHKPRILEFIGESKVYSIVTTQDDEVNIDIHSF